jgi:hypothetical protein
MGCVEASLFLSIVQFSKRYVLIVITINGCENCLSDHAEAGPPLSAQGRRRRAGCGCGR